MKDVERDLPAPASRSGLSRRALLNGAAVAGGVALAAAFGSDGLKPQTVSAQTPPNDALTAARFSISVDGHEIAAFGELESILSAVDISDGLPKKLPGKRTPPTVTLRRGMTRNIEMTAWHELVILGDVAARKDCSLVIYDVAGDPVARYHLENAWPAKLEIGALKAGSSEVLMETVTMTCEFIQRVAV